MSLGIVVKGPAGLVLAAESRITLTAQTPQGGVIRANYDNATKLLTFDKHPYVAVVTYGQAAIGRRTAASLLPEFESSKINEDRLSICEFGNRLSKFFLKQWQATESEDYKGPNMTFIVAGFDKGQPYGKVFVFEIPGRPELTEKHSEPGEFGLTWGGQREFVDRLIQGYDERVLDIVSKIFNPDSDQVAELEEAFKQLQMNLPLEFMPLQDCVDLAIFSIRTAITAQRLAVGIRGVGGPIDVATITGNEGVKFIQRKKITGEIGMISDIIAREQS